MKQTVGEGGVMYIILAVEVKHTVGEGGYREGYGGKVWELAAAATGEHTLTASKEKCGRTYSGSSHGRCVA